jgi:hypothetical protein
MAETPANWKVCRHLARRDVLCFWASPQRREQLLRKTALDEVAIIERPIYECQRDETWRPRRNDAGALISTGRVFSSGPGNEVAFSSRM